MEATIGDLARYLAACLTPPDGPLGAAIRLCQQPRVSASGGSACGLAWVMTDGLLFHNGGTGGFSASMTIDQAAGHAAAALVNSGGSSAQLLDAVVMAAVKGDDPRRIRPRDTGQAAGPEWDERAVALARALIDGDYAGVHQMLNPQDQPKLTAERLGQMWQFARRQIGDPGPVSVSCRVQPDGVAALITFTGSKSPLTLLVGFAPAGRIDLLRAVAPDEALPW